MAVIILLLTLFPAAVLFGAPPRASADLARPVDKTLVRSADVTGDGIAERIALRIKGKRFTAPFTWSLSIMSKGQLVFAHHADDHRIDELFNEDDYVDGCSGYVGCKSKHYFKDILDTLITPPLSPDERAGITDRSVPNSIYVVGRAALLKCCTKDHAIVDQVIAQMIELIKAGKAITLYVMDSPVHGHGPLMWVPKFRRFIPIYEE